MNYLASLILIGVEFDEALAFTILTKLMENEEVWLKISQIILSKYFNFRYHFKDFGRKM